MPKRTYLFIVVGNRYSPYALFVFREREEGELMETLYQNHAVYGPELEDKLVDLTQRFNYAAIGTNAESEEEFARIQTFVDAAERRMS